MPNRLKVARDLAEETGVPEATALEIYEREYQRLSAFAKVTQYLEILTIKNVKAALQSQPTAAAESQPTDALRPQLTESYEVAPHLAFPQPGLLKP